MRWLVGLMALSSVTLPVFGLTRMVDKSSSKVEWVGTKKLIDSTHSGTVAIKDGSIEFAKDQPKKGVVMIDMMTIKNDDISDEKYRKKLVGHLMSEDFFAVKKHPTAKLEMTEIKPLKGKMYSVKGFLTIKGMKKDINFKAQIDQGMLQAKMTFDRTKYNIRYGSDQFFKSLGDKVISDDVIVNASLKLK